MEHMGGCSNGWALSLDDQDISQLLPLKGLDLRWAYDVAVLPCDSMLNEGSAGHMVQ